MTQHLSSVDIYGEYFIHHLGDEYKDAASIIFHVRNQLRLDLPIDDDTQKAYEDAQYITKLGNFQRKNTRRINEFITKKLEDPSDDADSSFVSATGSDPESGEDDDSSSESDATVAGEEPPPEEADEQDPEGDDNEDDDANEGDDDEDDDDANMAAREHHPDHRAGTANPCDYTGIPDDKGAEPKGNEINLIPDFKGDGSADAEIWIRRVETVAKTYGWKKSRWQQAAATRLSSDALKWLEAKSRVFEFPYPFEPSCAQGKCHEMATGAPAGQPQLYDEPAVVGKNSWIAFRDAFFLRFKPITDAAAAVRAVQDLKQGPNKSVHAFYDRVSIAVDRKNYRVKDKTTDAYANTRNSDQYSFFAAGLLPDIKKMALGGPRPSTDLEVFLGDCINAELILGKSKNVQEVQVEEGKADADGKPEEATATLTVAELKKEIDALRANMKCFRCGETGHLRRQCKAAPKDSASGGNNENINRSNNNRRRGGGRGNQNNRSPPRRPGQQRDRARRQGGGQNQGGFQNQGYQKGNWNRAQRGWLPQANFGQPGNYYQNHMISQQAPFMPYPYGPAMSTGSGGSQNSSSITSEPWVLAGNE